MGVKKARQETTGGVKLKLSEGNDAEVLKNQSWGNILFHRNVQDKFSQFEEAARSVPEMY